MLWAAWDTVTRAMVPQEELMNKPIKLRNNLIFYLGHIPTFAGERFAPSFGAAAKKDQIFISPVLLGKSRQSRSTTLQSSNEV
jgi:hypothetical protein